MGHKSLGDIIFHMYHVTMFSGPALSVCLHMPIFMYYHSQVNITGLVLETIHIGQGIFFFWVEKGERWEVVGGRELVPAHSLLGLALLSSGAPRPLEAWGRRLSCHLHALCPSPHSAPPNKDLHFLPFK